MSGTWRRILLDRVGVQLNAYTWYRYRLISPFLVPGSIRTLNIGTGGGMESMRLLRNGNHVTTIEIDEGAAQRTRDRIVRNGYADRHVGLTGHILDVPLEGQFHMILMCEVLEHVMNDIGALKRLSQWLLPGGRLVLSTPTSSYGRLPGDTISATEDGRHVRVGYDGPELDAMLRSVGLTTIRRVFNGNTLVQWQLSAERVLLGRSVTRLPGAAFALFSRPFLPLIDVLPHRYFDQITLATKTVIE